MFLQGCYELYGADFVVGADLSVWLIEINSSPALSPSTEITRRMCAQVLEDTVKVVIDKKENKLADTGRFELAIKQVSKLALLIFPHSQTIQKKDLLNSQFSGAQSKKTFYLA